MDKEERFSWIIFFLIILIPHSVLIASIFLFINDVCHNPLGIQSLKDFLEAIYYIATITGVVYAVKAYEHWKKSLQADWDRDAKKSMSEKISNIGEKLLDLATIIHELSNISREVQHHIKYQPDTPWPQKPKEHDFQVYLDIFTNKDRASIAASHLSASKEYIDLLKNLEDTAYKLTDKTSEIYKTFSDHLYDDQSNPLSVTIESLDQQSSKENIEELYELHKTTTKKYKKVNNYNSLNS